MTESWLKGRKDIGNHMNVCWDTVRRWRRKYGCPVHVAPGGRPIALASELDRWLISFGREKENREEEQGGGKKASEFS